MKDPDPGQNTGDAPGAGSQGANPGEHPTPGSQPAQSRLSRIAARAQEIYLQRGGADGKDLDDWLQAEREIDAAGD